MAGHQHLLLFGAETRSKLIVNLLHAITTIESSRLQICQRDGACPSVHSFFFVLGMHPVGEILFPCTMVRGTVATLTQFAV